MFNNNAKPAQPNIFANAQNNAFANNQSPNTFNNQQPNLFANNQQQQQGNNMFRAGNPAPQTNNIFANNTQNTPFAGQPNNTFNAPAQTNMFNNPQPNNNIFANAQQQQPQQQQQNLFGQRPNQPNNNIFANTQQGFNQGAQQPNLFANTQQQQTNMFTGQTNNFAGQGNMFAGQGNAFNTAPQGNMFAQGQQQSCFGQGQPQNNMFQGQMVGSGAPNSMFPSQMAYFNLLTFTAEQQQQLIRGMTNDQVRKFIDHCLKALVDPKKLEYLTLTSDNSLRNEKASAVAAKFNIRQQLLQVKKEVRDKVVVPVRELKQVDQQLATFSSELASKVTEKLQRYKEALIEAISENKMIEDIKREIGELEGQIKDFLKPLFNAHQTRTTFSFLDPDHFCIRVSEHVLKNIAYLDAKMDELLACEADHHDATDTGQVIERLVEYYENVVISLREFAEKYQRQKKEVLSKRRMGNADDLLRRIGDKANQSVRKELKAYELVKDIEQILQKRQNKADPTALE